MGNIDLWSCSLLSSYNGFRSSGSARAEAMRRRRPLMIPWAELARATFFQRAQIEILATIWTPLSPKVS